MAVVLEDFSQDDIEFVPQETNVFVPDKRPKHWHSRYDYPNPYRMNPYDVRKKYFREARLYDSDITEPGWRIPTYMANRKYRRWLRKVRREPGMRYFRRPMNTHDEEETDENEEIKAPSSAPRPSNNSQSLFQRGKKRNVRLLPQSRVKGAKPGDEDFKPKMFTTKMGAYISALRQQNNMTQVELARKLNVDAATIRNIEKGNLVTFNSEDVMVKEMAKILGVPSIKYME